MRTRFHVRHELVAGWLLPILRRMTVQVFLVFREQIFSPIDELSHADYVRTIAEEGRLPVYGEDRVDPTLLAIYYRVYPSCLTAAQLREIPIVAATSYEALQFPVVYLAAAPI